MGRSKARNIDIATMIKNNDTRKGDPLSLLPKKYLPVTYDTHIQNPNTALEHAFSVGASN
jgi:hypothetical protein